MYYIGQIIFVLYYLINFLEYSNYELILSFLNFNLIVKEFKLIYRYFLLIHF